MMRILLSVLFYGVCISNCFADVEVKGVFLDEKGDVALINDQMLEVGDTVEKAKIIEITKKGVVFEGDGQVFLVPIQDSNTHISAPKVFLPKEYALNKAINFPKISLPTATSHKTDKAAPETPGLLKGSVYDPAAVKNIFNKVENVKAIAEERNKKMQDQLDQIQAN